MALKERKIRAPGGPGRLSVQQAAELPDRLLDAALTLFSELGYAETSMEKIARRAGASTKTIYGRYANKGAILQAVVRRLIDQTVAETDQQTRIAPGETELRELLVNFCANIGVTLQRPEAAGLNRLAFAEAHRSPELREFFEGGVGRGRGIIRAALEHWKAEGRLPLLEDPAAAATQFLSMTTDLPRIRAVLGFQETPAAVRAYVEAATDIFLRGLGYRAEQGGDSPVAPALRPSPSS